MTVRCSYCGERIRTLKGAEGISHGICGHCLPEALADYEISMRDYLETFEEPAVLVDSTGFPVAANDAFKKALAMSTIGSEALVKGVNQRSDENTVEMVIRRALESGKDVEHVPAATDLDAPETTRHLTMLIGVFHAGDELIVKVERLTECELQ